MMLKVRLLVLLTALFAVTLASAAQDENTVESPDENACYAGGSLEGKCDWPTEAEDEWAWTCGWYIARAERGTISESSVPNWCNYFTTPICYGGGASVYEVQMIGLPDRANNAIAHGTLDGTCSDPRFAITIITSPIDGPFQEVLDMASEKCAEIIGVPVTGAIPVSTLVLIAGVPEDYWLCIETA
jgi:hypothetical protein